MTPPPFRVCFVCSGNICRSPYAEVLLRRMAAEQGLADRIEASSLGTLGIEGHAAHEMTAQIAAESDMTLISFRSRGTNRERVAAVDLLIGLAPEHVRELREQFPEVDPGQIWLITDPGGTADDVDGIPDPIGTGEDEYRGALAAIDAVFPALWRAIQGRMGGDGS
jgi:protein-tyrosine phosphatase